MRPPPQSHTPRRAFRIPNDEWEPFVDKAYQDGKTASELIRRFIRQYINPAKLTEDQIIVAVAQANQDARHLWLRNDNRTDCCWQNIFEPDDPGVFRLSLTAEQDRVTCPASMVLAPEAKSLLARFQR